MKADGTPARFLSPFVEATRDADRDAFAALARRIRTLDPTNDVVIGLQVENEIPGERDFGPAARAAFATPVPADLLAFLQQHEQELSDATKGAWVASGHKTSGTWTEVFGAGAITDQLFMAYQLGKFVDGVASAAKAVLAVPMHVNVWLGASADRHETMDAFFAGAPSIDADGPDLYDPKGFEDRRKVLRLYRRSYAAVTHVEGFESEELLNDVFAEGIHLSGRYNSFEKGDNESMKELWAIAADLLPLAKDRIGSAEFAGLAQLPRTEKGPLVRGFGRFELTMRPTRVQVDWRDVYDVTTGGELYGTGLVMTMPNDEVIAIGTRFDLEWRTDARKPVYCRAAEVGHFEGGVWRRERAVTSADVENAAAGCVVHFPQANRSFKQIKLRLGDSLPPDGPADIDAAPVDDVRDGAAAGSGGAEPDAAARVRDAGAGRGDPATEEDPRSGGTVRGGCGCELASQSGGAGALAWSMWLVVIIARARRVGRG